MTNRALAVIICCAALLFGSVEAWSITLVVFSVLTLSLVWLFRESIEPASADTSARFLILMWAFYLLYSAAQVLPVPSPIVRIVSPAAWQSWGFYSFAQKSTMTISLDPYRTSLGLVKGMAPFAVFCMLVLSQERSRTLRRALDILVIFGFAVALFGLVQKAAWNGKIYWFRELTMGGDAFGPFVNKNHYAGLIGMIIPLGLGISLASRNTGKKVLYGFFSAIMSISLFFSLSRGGIISFFVVLFVFAALAAIGSPGKKKLWFFGLFIFVVAAYLLYLGINPVISRFASTDVSTEARLVVWTASLNAIRDYWFTGSGLGTFILVFPVYAPPGLNVVFDHAHNDYIELLLESGVAGTAPIIGFALLFLKRIIAAVRSMQTGPLFAGALAGVSSMMVHSVSDFNLHILSNSLLFAFVLGLTVVLARPERQAAAGAPGNKPLSGEEILSEYEHIAAGEFAPPEKSRRSGHAGKTSGRPS